jgi:hypothetical protein
MQFDHATKERAIARVAVEIGGIFLRIPLVAFVAAAAAAAASAAAAAAAD